MSLDQQVKLWPEPLFLITHFPQLINSSSEDIFKGFKPVLRWIHRVFTTAPRQETSLLAWKTTTCLLSLSIVICDFLALDIRYPNRCTSQFTGPWWSRLCCQLPAPPNVRRDPSSLLLPGTSTPKKRFCFLGRIWPRFFCGGYRGLRTPHGPCPLSPPSPRPCRPERALLPALSNRPGAGRGRRHRLPTAPSPPGRSAPRPATSPPAAPGRARSAPRGDTGRSRWRRPARLNRPPRFAGGSAAPAAPSRPRLPPHGRAPGRCCPCPALRLRVPTELCQQRLRSRSAPAETSRHRQGWPGAAPQAARQPRGKGIQRSRFDLPAQPPRLLSNSSSTCIPGTQELLLHC